MKIILFLDFDLTFIPYHSHGKPLTTKTPNISKSYKENINFFLTDLKKIESLYKVDIEIYILSRGLSEEIFQYLKNNNILFQKLKSIVGSNKNEDLNPGGLVNIKEIFYEGTLISKNYIMFDLNEYENFNYKEKWAVAKCKYIQKLKDKGLFDMAFFYDDTIENISVVRKIKNVYTSRIACILKKNNLCGIFTLKDLITDEIEREIKRNL